ncbi:nickel pincer cofactor biosynthesis protein LarC [Thermosulfuriphilus sp.]
MVKTALYLDCFSGISGDMFVGALLDLGAPQDRIFGHLKAALPELGLSSPKIKKGAIIARGFEVSVKETSSCRPLSKVLDLLEKIPLSSWVKDRAREIFKIIGQAEAKIHGCRLDEVCLHELGAEDSIADVLAVLLALESLGRPEIISSPLPLGRGFILTSHGRLPLPAPATLEILKGTPTLGEEVSFEFVTPTGAALVKALASDFGPPPTGIPLAVGYGAGNKELSDRPNILRAVLYRLEAEASSQKVAVLEANIDDVSPQVYGFLMEKLFSLGALDVCLIPAQMKKNRPGLILKVIAPPGALYDLAQVILSETTTIGLRYSFLQRLTLPRRQLQIKTPWGIIRAKEILLPQGGRRLRPEYEDCRRIAEEQGVPLLEIISWVEGRGSEGLRK